MTAHQDVDPTMSPIGTAATQFDKDSSYGCGSWGYATAIPLYRDAGWISVLPLPAGAKSPPPQGFTGRDGRVPSDWEYRDWALERQDANLALRLPTGLVGIDVDAYGSKSGARTLVEAELRWGSLPRTYRSSARSDDDVSGIRLFRVPLGMEFCGDIRFPELGIADIELIQPHLRYVTAWPSTHPSGSRYRWYGPDGAMLPEGCVPHVDGIPVLP